ncbi:MAG: metallophosphoesterase [Eubacteriales bacterium]|nr:metallophosphoesterase [Eubacteriales bacterium]
MKIWALGDTHLSLDNRIDKPMDVFGGEWKEHADKLKANWLEKVSPEDTVLICGDISWGLKLDEAMADLDFLHELPGCKVLTKGNHDLWWTSISKIDNLYDDMVFVQNKAFEIADGVCVCGTRGWACPGSDGFDEHERKIYERELSRLELSLQDAVAKRARYIISMLHYPPTNEHLQPSGFTELMTRYGVKTCVYGHLHGHDAFHRGLKGILNGVEYKLVSLDYIKCDPILLDEIEE